MEGKRVTSPTRFQVAVGLNTLIITIAIGVLLNPFAAQATKNAAPLLITSIVLCFISLVTAVYARHLERKEAQKKR
jgi:hypothetical protein